MVSSAFKTLAKADQDSHSGDLPNLIYPQGTFNSPIAIVLEEPNSFMSLHDGEPNPNVDKYAVHLGKKGLTPDKCLVFYTYCRQRLMRLSDQDRKLPVNTRETKELKWHEDFCDLVLEESPATVILLCGKLQAERILEQNGTSLRQLFLKFGFCQLSIWLQMKGDDIVRIYINLPSIEKIYYRGDWAAIQKYEHAINVAAALTATEGVRIRFFEGAHVLGLVLRCMQQEKNGFSYSSLGSLHLDILYWLERNEHLVEVEGQWRMKDPDRFQSSGKSLIKYIHHLLISKGAQTIAAIVAQRALGNARQGGEVTLYSDDYSPTSTRLRFGILSLPRINIPVDVTKSWGLRGPVKVNIRYDITENAHPNPFAKEAKHSDDAIRLGISMEHAGRQVWLTRRGPTAIKMANTLFDWLNGVSTNVAVIREDRYPRHSTKRSEVNQLVGIEL
jgi:hypothetical protein